MKGVSEIIAIILILMIVIALAALAYTWFSGVFAQLTGQTSTAVQNTANQMNTQFRIESSKNGTGWVSVSIRNLGTQGINGSNYTTGFYVDGNPVTSFCIAGGTCGFAQASSQPTSCTGCTGNPGLNTLISPSGVATYNLSVTPATCGSSLIKVTNSVALDSRMITC